MARIGSPLANVSAERIIQDKTVVSRSNKEPLGGLLMRISGTVKKCNYEPRKQTVPQYFASFRSKFGRLKFPVTKRHDMHGSISLGTTSNYLQDTFISVKSRA